MIDNYYKFLKILKEQNQEQNQEKKFDVSKEEPKKEEPKKEEIKKEETKLDSKVQKELDQIQSEVEKEASQIVGDVKSKIKKNENFYIREAAGMSFAFLSAMILSLPKLIGLLGIAIKKLRNLFKKEDKKWNTTKLEEWGEELHEIYINTISKVIKSVSKVFGKWELSDKQAKKIATYIYWIALIYLGLSGAASLMTSAGKYGLGAGTAKAITTLTKTYEISLIVVAAYLVITSSAFKSIEDAVHGLEKCVENPPKDIKIEKDKLQTLIKKGGKRPSSKTYKRLVICAIKASEKH